MGRQIIIGDVHGCYDELCDLLDRVGATADDRIILLGDLLDRGPQPDRILQFLRETPNAIALRGNHDQAHLHWQRHGGVPGRAQQITRRLLREKYSEAKALLAGLPLFLDLPEADLIHGLLEPGVPLPGQRPDVLLGEKSGEEYMRARYPGPWYEHHAGPRPVICGHHHYLGNGQPLIREGRVYAIDTGCTYGYRLTALILPGFDIVSVPARADHWTAIKRAQADA